jgi:D-alanine-D-alanine ligase-like ATP-grasp enzyme
VAPEIDAQVLIEPEYGYVGMIQFKNGKHSFFRNRNFNVNPQGASDIARDKGYAAFFLQKLGYPVPEGKTFFSAQFNKYLNIKRTMDDGYGYARQLGFPVIVKPNDSSQGKFVTKVHTKAEYYRAARKIFKSTRVMLVQRYYAAQDYRIVVMDDEVISVYLRTPLVVEGDGATPISGLLESKATAFKNMNRDTELDFDDYRIRMKLRRQGLSFESVLARGQALALLDNANLSTGGDALDMTEAIHPDFAAFCVRVTRDMGLRLCGVDVITEDITRPLAGQHPVVLEINSAPGLDNYASIGEEQHRRVEHLYRTVLLALERA